ncbi:hypothetical protein QFX18_02605 [Saccharophagus degradans]|uniref:hypothetical protein n=1 Tax=Saccharophagus degradans TaxID=86304 RepID=UPI002477FDCD|nr:hypothetical protein [Saccharophagus degradans]WGO98951.1 hypothetical protein QFX18_02605 [Saccharophagus degradans]
MTKWILIVALALGGVIIWKFAPLTGGGASKSDLLATVPADTAFYVGGNSSEELAEFMRDYSIIPTTPTQMAQWAKMLEEISGSETPAAQFFASLQRQIAATEGSTLTVLEKTGGISNTGNYALYLHGAVPVARLTLSDPAAFDAMIEKAVADSNFTYNKATIGAAEARVWRITDADEALQVDLAVAVADSDLAITFFIGADDEATKKERIGQSKPAKSLASSGEIANIQKQYGFNDAMVTFVHIERIVQGILKPESNSFGKDLQRYLPEDAKAGLAADVTEACRTDYLSLAASMPRLVSGYSALEIKGNTLYNAGDFILELTNESVKTELGKMRGHLPLHTLNTSDKLMSFSAGVNMDQLVPAVTALWNQFTQAPYSCEALVEMQNKAKETSPAMLAMAMGMAQGVKGLGVSFYDFKMDEMMMPSSLSFLASVATENPGTLASLTSMIPVPGLNELVIPADGTAVPVPVPMLPPSIEVKAAIKGKHLVVYAGAKAEAEVAKIEQEAITPNGLYAIGLNYRRFGELLELQSNGMFAQGGGEGCIAQQEMKHMMQNLKMDFAVSFDVNNQGLVGHAEASMDKPTTSTTKLPGKYQLAYLDGACNWETAGVETINADGTGSVTEKSNEGDCNTYESAYTWTQAGSVVSMASTSDRYRESCDSEWEDNDLSTYECHILNVSETGFQCLFDPGSEDASIYSYTRM